MEIEKNKFREQELAGVLVSVFSPSVVISPELGFLFESSVTTCILQTIWMYAAYGILYVWPYQPWNSPPFVHCQSTG